MTPKARALVDRQAAMSGPERKYELHLRAKLASGEILRYDYAPESLRLGNCYYRPDFRVVRKDGLIEMIDCKGTRKNGSYWAEEESVAKIRAAPALHPYFFVIVWQTKDGVWQREEYTE